MPFSRLTASISGEPILIVFASPSRASFTFVFHDVRAA